MTCQDFIEALMPCLGRRKPSASHGNDNSTATPSGKRPVRPARPEIEDGLEVATALKRTKSFSSHVSSSAHGFTTTIIAELPTQQSPTKSVRPMRLRSFSTGTTGSKKRGKRKKTQQLNISAPMNFRHVNGENSSHSTFTYPSPGRTRPWRLAPDASQSTSDNDGRPRTAPSPPSGQNKSFVPHRSGSLPLRAQSSKLTALPPVPPLDLKKGQDNDSRSERPLKRKPVPIRTRATSEPTSPTFIPDNFAAEMLGSVPSPVKLEAPDIFGAKADNGQNKNVHKPMASVSSLPSPGLFSSRLSVGALNLLTFFPSAPKQKKADSSPKATLARSKTQLSKKSNLEDDITALPQAHTRRARGGSSPSTSMPPALLPDLPTTGSPRRTDPQPFLEKSLPPTPRSGSFERTNVFAVRPGSMLEEMSATALTPTSAMGKKPWIEAAGLGSDTESIQIFLASSVAGSPRW